MKEGGREGLRVCFWTETENETEEIWEYFVYYSIYKISEDFIYRYSCRLVN